MRRGGPVRCVVLGLLATVAAAGVRSAAADVAPAAAGPARGSHGTLVHRSFDEPRMVTPVQGLGPGCPDFVGRLVERRHLVQSGYVRGARARISTVVDARVRLIPDDDSAASYRGSYRSLQVGVFDRGGKRTVRSTTLTLGHLRGDDGAAFSTVEDARVRRDGAGHVHRTDSFHCD